MVQHFTVILLREEGPVPLTPGMQITISETAPDIKGAYTSVQCGECSRIFLLRGLDFGHARTNIQERPQGREKIYNTDLHASCPGCDTEHFAEVDYMEYPENTLQTHHMKLLSDLEYVDIGHLELLAQESASIVKTTERNLRSEVQMLRRAVNAGYTPGPIRDLESALNQIITFINKSIMVLGSYSGASRSELRNIQHKLEKRNYDANIAEDLPDDSKKRLRQNIATQIMLSRFCMMVDKEPSGHINEYEIARDQDTVLARLTPEDSGSTQMIRDNPDRAHIETFEYKTDPDEVLDEAISWAEEYVEQREKDNLEKWDWYTETDPTKGGKTESIDD